MTSAVPNPDRDQKPQQEDPSILSAADLSKFRRLADVLNSERERLAAVPPEELMANLPSHLRSDLQHALNAIAHASDKLDAALCPFENVTDVPQVPIQYAYEVAPQPIREDKIAVVTKRSKLELDAYLSGKTFKDVKRRYKEGAEDEKRILKSHRDQKHVKRQLRKLIPQATFLTRDEAETTDFSNFELVIALGGDNHFQFVAELLSGSVRLLGMNSDPSNSTGALLEITLDKAPEAIDRLKIGKYEVDPWTRIDVYIDDVLVGRASNDVFVGEQVRLNMSRNAVEIENGMLEQKSSGLLIATGCGSTGWYRSEGKELALPTKPFPRNAPYARSFVTAHSSSRLSCHEVAACRLPEDPLRGIVLPNKPLVLSSLNDSNGVIGLDSLSSHPFPRGSKARIEISAEPLWAVKF